MSDSDAPAIELIDRHPRLADFREEVLAGLRATPKTLPAKFFYDEEGSRLFVEITRLPEYYLTRTERSILTRRATEMVSDWKANAVLVDLGSGASRKVRILLDALEVPITYMPVDISREHLEQSAMAIASDYDNVRVVAVCSDYTAGLDIPDWDRYAQRILFFPGSTIGNLDPSEARTFLSGLARRLVGEDGMLVGFDLAKDRATLEAAYDDSRGVTAEFNINVLRRINRELGAAFDLDAFEHAATFNERESRIEMHLRSRRAQRVAIGDAEIAFAEGESIHTESSYKYTLDSFAAIVDGTGFRVARTWADDAELFAMAYLEVTETDSTGAAS